MMWFRILLFILLAPSVSLAATYHFANSGNDTTGNGSAGNPYATIERAESLPWNPGDNFLFECGSTFRQVGNPRFITQGSGANGNPITIGAYGTCTTSDDYPIFTKSQIVTGWNNAGTNLYSNTNVPGNLPAGPNWFFDDLRAAWREEDDAGCPGSMTENYQVCYNGARNTVYVRTTDGNPNNLTNPGVERIIGPLGPFLDINHSWITVNRIRIHKTGNCIRVQDTSNLNVVINDSECSETAWKNKIMAAAGANFGAWGISTFVSENAPGFFHITNSRFYGIGRDAIDIDRDAPDGNVLIDNNVFDIGYNHNVMFIGKDSGGDAFFPGTVTISNNVASNFCGGFLFGEGGTTGGFANLRIIGNTITDGIKSDDVENGMITRYQVNGGPDCGNTPQGIFSFGNGNTVNALIAKNTIIRTYYGIQWNGGTLPRNTKIHHNTCVDTEGACIFLADNHTDAQVYNNLMTQNGVANSYLVRCHPTSNCNYADIQRNYFDPDNSNSFVTLWEGNSRTLASAESNLLEWNANNIGNDAGATPANLVVDRDNGNLMPATGSPLVDAGLDTGLDLNGSQSGNFNGSAPDIGAIEAGTSPPGPDPDPDPEPGLKHYVSPTGLGTTCSLEDPCSLNEGINQAQAGQSVVLTDGTYSQSLATVRSGADGSRIIIQAQNSMGAVVNGSAASLVFIDHSHITIKDIHFFDTKDGFPNTTSPGPVLILVEIWRGASHITLESNRFEHCGGVCVHIEGRTTANTNIRIRNNYFDGSGYKNDGQGEHIRMSASGKANPGVVNALIHGNEFYDFTAAAIDMRETADQVWIYDNTFHGQTTAAAHGATPEPTREGMVILQGSGVQFYQNIIRDSATGTELLKVRQSHTGTFNEIYNNIFYDVTGNTTAISCEAGNTGEAARFYNNTLWNLGNHTVVTPGCTPVVVNNLGINGLANNLATSGFDTTYFVDSDGGDFRLTDLATDAINAVMVSPYSEEDFAGKSIIDGIRDYGAYELGDSPPPDPPPGGAFPTAGILDDFDRADESPLIGPSAGIWTNSVDGEGTIIRMQSATGNGDPASASFGSAVTEGSLLIAVDAERSGGDASNMVISGSGWTHQVARTIQPTETEWRRTLCVWYKVAGASEPRTLTVDDGTNNIKRLATHEFSHQSATAAWTFESSASNDNGQTSGATSISTGTTASVGAGDLFKIGVVGIKRSPSTGSQSATWTNGLSDNVSNGNSEAHGRQIITAWSGSDASAGTKESTATLSGEGIDGNLGLDAAILVFSVDEASAYLQVISQTLRDGSGEGSAYITQAFGADQEVYMTLPNAASHTASLPTRIFACLQNSGLSSMNADGYGVRLIKIDAADDSLSFFRMTDSGFTTIGDVQEIEIGDDDKIGMRMVSDGTMNLYVDQGAGWNLIYTQNDTFYSCGNTHIGVKLSDATMQGDDFGGGNTVQSGPSSLLLTPPIIFFD